MTKVLTVLLDKDSRNKKQQQQGEWVQCIREISHYLAVYKDDDDYFFGGTSIDAPCQNVCWIASIHSERLKDLKKNILSVCKQYKQSNVTFLEGEAEYHNLIA